MTMSAEDRTLILLRHAKAAPGRAGQDDRERPLCERGREDAGRLGRWLREQGLGCDEVMCSPSLRTRETMEEVAAAGCAEAEIDIVHQLYNATPEDILAAARTTSPDATVLAVVGHAPGLPATASLLADGNGTERAHDAFSQGFPPAGVAVLRFSGHWSDLAFGAADLTDFWSPALDRA